MPRDDGSIGDADSREAHIIKVDPCYFMMQGYTEVRNLGLLQADDRSSLLDDNVSNNTATCTTVQATCIPNKLVGGWHSWRNDV